MSKTVLEVVNEGINKVGLDEINSYYENIICDFYNRIYVIDKKSGLVRSTNKYNENYSCFDSNREKGLLSIDIGNDNVVSVSYVKGSLSKTMMLKSMVENSTTKGYKLDRIGFLSLKSAVENEDVIHVKEVKFCSGGAIIKSNQLNSGKKQEDFLEPFSYSEENKTLSYIIDGKRYVEEDVSKEESLSKIYKRFYERKPF